MIRLVVCDVDGTLVKDGGSASALNPEYYEVVRKLSEKGIQVVICSGRQKASIEKLFEPVKDLLHIISEGGSLIFQKEECIYSQILQKEVCRQIIDDAEKLNLAIFWSVGKNMRMRQVKILRCIAGYPIRTGLTFRRWEICRKIYPMILLKSPCIITIW